MKIHTLFITSIFLFMLPIILTGNEPEKRNLIIDTDCASDDLRAINLILSSYDVNVLAITTEDGTLEPEEGYIRINTLLNELGHEGIPSAQGILTKNKSPEWSKIARKVPWGKEIISYNASEEIKEFLVKTIENESKPVDILCIGPLTNIANAILMKPSIKKEIGRIIWFDQCQPDSQWTNYGMDCLSADYILQTEIPVYRIMAGEKSVKYSEELHKEIGQLNTPYAQSIYRAHDIDTIQKKIAETHLGIWDDLAALYYLNPELFKNDTSMADTLGRVMIVKEDVNVKEKIIQVLHTYFKDMNQVFSPFPTDTTYYQDDIKHFTDSIIKLYGLREWKAMVLTNEIHSHLGLYSIIGTKMGIRSLEYFRARQGELNITSFAGKETPLSCLNDGLQVATGSTVGNGQFILEGNQQTPRATIVCEKSGKIEIKLKTQFYNKIQQEIIKAKNMHPNFSDKYWETIRKKAVDIWQNWDRKEIFEINKR